MLRRAALLSLLLLPTLGAVPAAAHHREGEPPDDPGAEVETPEVAEVPEAAESPEVWEDETPDDDGYWPEDRGTPEGVPAVPEVEDLPGADGPWPTLPTPEPVLPVVRGKTVPGRDARLRADGKAAIPLGAPQRVRTIIRAANEIVGKPYKWGGGHATLVDRGYDCSGAVGYSLTKGGLLGAPMVSGQLARWGSAGAGRWITVYATRSHVYMQIAGLRLDTSPVGDQTRRNGVRWRPVIGARDRFHVRHPAGL